MNYNNGDKFEGEWENNKEKNGEGKVIFNDGIYKGIIKDSKKEGK